VGINLAVADAVATARLLAPALRSGGIVPRSLLRKVQRRRWWPAALIQGGQRIAHRAVFRGRGATAGTPVANTDPIGLADGVPLAPAEALPPPLRLLRRFPVLQGVPARLIAIGPLPEHAPDWARRTTEPAAR
jgi:2-polyprenyl-6-methoxyphenol hydroxylase-like FAD-dependent oxidoreductase